MTNNLIKSVVFLTMSTAGIPAFAQTEQPAQAQSTECPAGMECQQRGGQQIQQPDAQGATQQKPSADQRTTQGDQKGTDNAQPDAKDKGATQKQHQSNEQNKVDSKQQRPDMSPTQDQGGTNQQQGDKAKKGQGDTSQAADQSKSQSTDKGQAAGSSTTNITIEQKTEITQVIREEKVQPVDVDFDVSVGVVVPRTKVKLRSLPARIVKIVPRYESYLYFVLADGRIVIVEPATLKVVVVLA